MASGKCAKLRMSRKALAALTLAILAPAVPAALTGDRSTLAPEFAMGLFLIFGLANTPVAVSALIDVRRRKRRGGEIASIALVLLAFWFVMLCIPFCASIGWIGYCRLRLGMSEQEVVAILGRPAPGWRRSRHASGITSPGAEAMPIIERGIPLTGRFLEAGDGGHEATLLQDDRVEEPVVRAVTMRQWWGSSYAIDVAFDDDGRAIGIRLAWLRHFLY
jgi:hypothetical protein